MCQKYNNTKSKKCKHLEYSERQTIERWFNREKLKKVEIAEDYIKQLNINRVRVRVHNNIARIEVEEKEFQIIMDNKEKIVGKIKELGFEFVTLDLAGIRSGVFD